MIELVIRAGSIERNIYNIGERRYRLVNDSFGAVRSQIFKTVIAEIRTAAQLAAQFNRMTASWR
ncbi:hypothetical protein [Polaromonas sp.]|uniref:hypothetical protein n=1 Tax=Polaromonas sp. TaxID=1869339 RepID=UPI0037502B22